MAKKKKVEKQRSAVATKLKNALKGKKGDQKRKPFEDRPNLEKLYLYIIVVDADAAELVERLLQELGSSAQYTHRGRGTAPNELSRILGVSDDKKAVINAFVSEDKMPTIKQELNTFFESSRKNKGVAFAIQLSSIEGISMYKYLTQSL